jgi:hypothetical protein
MPIDTQSFFHKVNSDLTINLAEVAATFDHTKHITSLLNLPDNAEWAKGKLESGQTCLVAIRPERSDFSPSSGREFRITRAEMTMLQDALEWYNRHFAKTEKQ